MAGGALHDPSHHGEAEPPQAGRSPLPPGWPRWLAAVEDGLVRAAVAGLVALVVIQSLMAGQGHLALDTYGRVLEDWGYLPVAAGLEPAAPGAGPGHGQAGHGQAVLTLAGHGPGTVLVLLNGVPVAQLEPGQTRPVVVRPGDRLVLRSAARAAALVEVVHVAGPLHRPRPHTRWQALPQGTPLPVAWQ
ncbi:hypothetical protein [Thermaerobacter subterraneus]|uniref:Uncharacterized protein n=1 Tax=Thermaerobacter subterraneus DSM 13965 TaxID=867903 RepID=K6PZ83_9FIRM|nr:hypothetical protein [Thermaerobacter subterraneus]EKP93889.1 hypothetical protein ThesuDRAFT_00133 [Thermaerobacter subterraneus DSM 13965]